MGKSIFLKSPKKERDEKQVATDTVNTQTPLPLESQRSIEHHVVTVHGDFKDILGIEDHERTVGAGDDEDHGDNENDDYDDHDGMGGQLNFWEKESEFPKIQTFHDEDARLIADMSGDGYSFGNFNLQERLQSARNRGGGKYYYWDYDYNNKKGWSLNLSLNYQEVLEAWSNRGSLWATNEYYRGEVPVMEEKRIATCRREASVLRYKEKRQSRLFTKKIRYEVRKLNADKRPRIKGRFVKRYGDKKQMRERIEGELT